MQSLRKIVRAVFAGLKNTSFVSKPENLPCGTFLYASSCRKKKCSEISFLSRFARKKCSLRSQEISHYSGLRPSPSVRAVNEKFLSDASLRSELVLYLDWHLLWRPGGGLFEPKYGWKMIDLGPKTWFSGFGPFCDVIKGVNSGQKTPKCVFLYS